METTYWKDVTKATLKNAWHKLWLTTLDENKPAVEDFERFCVTNNR